MRYRFNIYDRFDRPLGVVSDVQSAVHSDELNGEDSLTIITATQCLAKGNRVVWRDRWGVWHEHIVNEVTDIHSDGKLYFSAYCENSLAELMLDYVDDKRPQNVSATVALQRALSTSRWEVGKVDITTRASASFYHISAHEALTEIVKEWGGEVSATIIVSGSTIVERRVNLQARRGDVTGKRFVWEKDIETIQRKVSSDDVYTALYGYGKGLAATDEGGNATGGYSRKLTFGSINGGLDYVADEAAKAKWGLPDGKGGIKHAFGKVEFSDCEDAAELKRLTQEALEERSKPRVSYTAKVLDLADAGFDFEDARTGDTVAVVDKGLGERLEGRVLKVERHLLADEATVITLGNLTRSITSVIAGQLQDMTWVKDHAGSWNDAATLAPGYMDGVVDALNTVLNATGGYTYYEPGEGITTYDKPKDKNPTMAIQIKGGGFRIANSKRSNGDWDWRTFGTGDGFTADVITAGTIRGGSSHWNLSTGDLLFKQGTISSADGKSTWNLTTGKLETRNMKAYEIDATGIFRATGSDSVAFVNSGAFVIHDKGIAGDNVALSALTLAGSGAGSSATAIVESSGVLDIYGMGGVNLSCGTGGLRISAAGQSAAGRTATVNVNGQTLRFIGGVYVGS